MLNARYIAVVFNLSKDFLQCWKMLYYYDLYSCKDTGKLFQSAIPLLLFSDNKCNHHTFSTALLFMLIVVKI